MLAARSLSWGLRGLAAALVAFGSLAHAAMANADAGTAETEIRDALARWTEAFNKRETAEICDLFSRDLVYDFRGFPPRDYGAICGVLKKSLGDPDRRYAYSFTIREILTFGEVAVVRLVWSLRVASTGQAAEALSEEPGMDLFRREADGRWRIFRYIAYENP